MRGLNNPDSPSYPSFGVPISPLICHPSSPISQALSWLILTRGVCSVRQAGCWSNYLATPNPLFLCFGSPKSNKEKREKQFWRLPPVGSIQFLLHTLVTSRPKLRRRNSSLSQVYVGSDVFFFFLYLCLIRSISALNYVFPLSASRSVCRTHHWRYGFPCVVTWPASTILLMYTSTITDLSWVFKLSE